MTSDILYTQKANGKLLLNSEYFVLDHAKAIALPCQLGQKLIVKSSDKNHWTSLDVNNEKWLDLDETFFESEEATSDKFIKTIQFIRKQVEIGHFDFHTYLEFDRNWGLGTSSTFIALIADFYKINPYQLNQQVFKGSGYDIACAFSEGPIMYQVDSDYSQPHIESIEIPESIKSHSYFVYLNKKMNSESSIKNYNANKSQVAQIVRELNDITHELLASDDVNRWIALLSLHNELISKNLGIKTINEEYNNSFPFFIKYLGAWGGDFAMILSTKTEEEIREICKKQFHFNTIIPYKDMVL